MTVADAMVLPPHWQAWYDILTTPGLTTADRKAQAIAYHGHNFRDMVHEVDSSEAADAIRILAQSPWDHGLKATVKDCVKAWESETNRLKQVKHLTEMQRLERSINSHASLWEGLSDNPPPPNLATTDDLADLVVPAKYRVTGEGVFYLSIDEAEGAVVETMIMPAPMFPVKRCLDEHGSGVELYTLWYSSAGWRGSAIPKTILLDTGKIMALADRDAPVASTRVQEIVKFLDAFESVNSRKLKTITVTHRCGWTENGSFVMPEQTWQAENDGDIIFSSPVGYETLMAAWTTKGSYEEWLRIPEIIANKPLMWVPLYTALAAPLLPLLGLNGWITDIAGKTGSGKTTALYAAASACGKATQDAPTVISSWDNTPVFIELICGYLRHLPVFLDETKRAGKGVVRQVTYNFAQGVGRGRGAKTGGVQKVHTWQTNAISTGEQTATSFSQDAGARARIVQMTGSPMGGFSERSAQAAEEVVRVAQENYGHVLPRVIDQLFPIRHDKEKKAALVKLFNSRRDTYSIGAATSVERRLAAYVALMSVVADILHGNDQTMFAGIGVPRPDCDPFLSLRESMRTSGEDSDRPLNALVEIVSRVTANKGHFWSPVGREQFQGEWFGKYQDRTGADAPDNFPDVGITTSILRRWLDDWGGTDRWQEICQQWAERGFVQPNGGRRGFTKPGYIDGGTVSMVFFSRKAWYLAGQKLARHNELVKEVGKNDPDIALGADGKPVGWADRFGD